MEVFMIAQPWHFCIIIPAKNEEELLPRCLQSLKSAINELPNYCTYDMVLAVDSSIDRTFEIGEKFILPNGMVINISEGTVGKARLLATEVALKRYRGNLEHCWLANTDADCEIPSNWLTYQLNHAMQGTQALAGIVSVDNFKDHKEHVAQRFVETYILNADGTHPHIHGANLGMRADAYIDAGGWNCLKTAEDHDLWNRLRLSNISMKSDSKLCVITSGRRIGRAPNGFADALAAHN
jgi:glycosyltransferase involved in cell wall biosynthesis